MDWEDRLDEWETELELSAQLIDALPVAARVLSLIGAVDLY